LIQIGRNSNNFAVQKRHALTDLKFSALPPEIAADGVRNFLVLIEFLHDSSLEALAFSPLA
jgi:hypothetical protein